MPPVKKRRISFPAMRMPRRQGHPGDRVEAAVPSGFVREWNINGEKMTLGVEVVGLI